MKHESLPVVLSSAPVLAILLALAIPVPSHASGVWPMAADGRLLLEVSNGLFVITGNDGTELRVATAANGQAVSSDISGTEQAWTLRFDSVDTGEPITIELPATAELEIQGDQAGLVVFDMNGPRLQMQSGSGAVRVERSRPGRLVVESVDGPMQLRSLGRRESRLSSLDGAIEASGESERLWLRTLSGQVDLNLQALLDLDAETLSGNLTAHLSPLEDAVLRARTHSGTLHIALPPDSGLDLRAESHTGLISSEFGGAAGPGQGSNKRLVHRSGNGQIRAELRSVDGPIEVTRLRSTARVLVFREHQHRSPSRVFGQRRTRQDTAMWSGVVDFGVDGEHRVSLQAGQYAELDIALDARHVHARHAELPDPVELEVIGLEPVLYCLGIAPYRRWVGSYDTPQVLVGFELSHRPCPESAELTEYERIDAD